MQIIASTTDGFLITATKDEVQEILRSVNGITPMEINIGQKIPAIDYASTITKLKALPQVYEYRSLMEKAKQFSDCLAKIDQAVNAASVI